MTNSAITLACAAIIAGAAITAPTSADARGGRVAAGIIGGLAAGALIAGAANAYGPRYGYGPYYYGAYAGPACHIRRERVWDGYGWHWRRVRVCY